MAVTVRPLDGVTVIEVGPGPGGLDLAFLGGQAKEFRTVQAHTTVGGPGIQDELAGHTIDPGIQFKMVRPGQQ